MMNWMRKRKSISAMAAKRDVRRRIKQALVALSHSFEEKFVEAVTLAFAAGQ